MFTCLKRNQVREVKVAQLCGAVAEMSSYHHGEVSLMGTIIGLAQDFVGELVSIAFLPCSSVAPVYGFTFS